MKPITSPDVIESTTLQLGFLPYFRGRIPGFSIEEHTPPNLWFAPDSDGPWEWKGLVIRRGNVVYAKLFERKAVYASMPCYCRLANIRRAACSLSPDERSVLNAISANESLLTTDIRSICGFNAMSDVDFLLSDDKSASPRRKSLDSILSRLQAACQIVVADFEYKVDKHGRPYGWGVARYVTPESLYPDSFALPDESPDASLDELLARLSSLFPLTDSHTLRRLLTKI